MEPALAADSTSTHNDAVPTSQPNSDGLASLLRSWNGGGNSLTPQNCGHLVYLAQRELGAAEAPASCAAADVGELSLKLRPLLPKNRQGQTVADVFTEIRESASRALKAPTETIAWDSAWTSIQPASLIAKWTGADFLGDVLLECQVEYHAALDEPLERVGEAVRWIWKARGGPPFWHLPPYERSWCPSQGIFYDLRQIAVLHQRTGFDTIEPSTPLSTLISRKQHGMLLYSIDHRFGVWLGRRAKEGCLPMLLAGVLVSPLSAITAACLVFAVSDPDTFTGPIVFLIYGLCIVIGVDALRPIAAPLPFYAPDCQRRCSSNRP